MHKLTIDGITVDLSDTAREVVSKALAEKTNLLADNLKLVSDHAEAMKARDAAHAEVVKAKDKELATKDAEIEKLKASQFDDAQKHVVARELADVMAKAAKVSGKSDLQMDGLSISAIRRVAVATALTDAAVQGKSDDYVEARFDGLYADIAKADPLGRAISDSLPTPPTAARSNNAVQLGDAATEYARMQERDRNAWKMGA
ncbi:hypothetical protein ACFQWF_14760 [Methylorubrum suomiense]